MKAYFQIFAFAPVIILSATTSKAQISHHEIEDLMNVSIVKGTIGEENVQKSDTKHIVNGDGKSPPSIFSIYGGVSAPFGGFSIPTGNLAGASTSGSIGVGGGYTGGIQFVTGGRIGFLVNASFSSNSIITDDIISAWENEMFYQSPFYSQQYASRNNSINSESTDNWTHIDILTGLKIGTAKPNGTNYFFAPIIGVDFAKYPAISVKFSSTLFDGNSSVPFTSQVTESAASRYSACLWCNRRSNIFQPFHN